VLGRVYGKFRHRREQVVVFIDARKLGRIRGRRRFLQESNAGRGAQAQPRAHARPLVGADAQEDDGEPFDEEMKRLVRRRA
jgi:hypothetical protein